MSDKTTGGATLLDHILRHGMAKNDAAISRALNVAPPVISKVRHNKLPVTPGVILAVHEAFDIPVATIRQIAGVPRLQAADTKSE